MSIILVLQIILEVPAPVVKSAVEFNEEFRALFILEKVTAVLNSVQLSHLGSTSPSIPYANSPRICSSVYSEVYLPEMEYWYKLVIHFSTQDLGEKLFSFVHVFYYNLL